MRDREGRRERGENGGGDGSWVSLGSCFSVLRLQILCIFILFYFFLIANSVSELSSEKRMNDALACSPLSSSPSFRVDLNHHPPPPLPSFIPHLCPLPPSPERAHQLQLQLLHHRQLQLQLQPRHRYHLLQQQPQPKPTLLLPVLLLQNEFQSQQEYIP